MRNAYSLVSIVCQKMPKEFKGLRLDREKIEPCLISSKLQDCKITKTEKSWVVTGSWEGKGVRLNVFLNGGGDTTLGQSSGFDREAFEAVAQTVADSCSIGDKPHFTVSVKLTATQVDDLTACLEHYGAAVMAKEDVPHGYRVRFKGTAGDTLSLTAYNSGTVVCQGRYLHTASLVWDYLYNVLGLEEVLEKQIATYKVPVTVADIKSELETCLPVAYGRLHEEIRKQLASALAMSKVDIALEDYGNMAFPSVRALEGFLYQEIRACGLTPDEKGNFGEYFDVNGSIYTVLPKVEGYLVEPKGSLLAGAYGLYHKQRHGLAHMTVALAGTRTLRSMAEAVHIINQVFDRIEEYYIKT